MALSKPLRGIVTPLLTPLADPGRLDPGSLARLLEHVLAGGVHGVFILGTTGEGPALSLEVQKECIAETCRIVNGRVPVMVGVTHSCLADAILLCRAAADAGAAAAVTAGPTYFPVSQAELAAYVKALAAASPVPLYLYNMPSHTHVRFDEGTVVSLAEDPKVIGLKDSAGQPMYLHYLLGAVAHRPDFTFLVGPEELMAECVLLGVHGGVNGGSNLFPRLYVDLHAAAVRGDLDAVRRLHARVIEISRRLYCVGSYGSSYLRGIKCAASLLGLIPNVLAVPYAPFAGAERDAVRRHLVELGYLS